MVLTPSTILPKSYFSVSQTLYESLINLSPILNQLTQNYSPIRLYFSQISLKLFSNQLLTIIQSVLKFSLIGC